MVQNSTCFSDQESLQCVVVSHLYLVHFSHYFYHKQMFNVVSALTIRTGFLMNSDFVIIGCFSEIQYRTGYPFLVF